ncbi:HTH_38 domain-containing protein [Trichonephila clavipes]|uniref:HTH_38 domain-containing protein n=1 Tax=Trichonephila clavipes TaxID=2585209 RepID=A0A8X6SC62_TRICX|nr:HTH_38 domain-containing protein [Trichonephila clavipes]
MADEFVLLKCKEGAEECSINSDSDLQSTSSWEIVSENESLRDFEIISDDGDSTDHNVSENTTNNEDGDIAKETFNVNSVLRKTTLLSEQSSGDDDQQTSDNDDYGIVKTSEYVISSHITFREQQNPTGSDSVTECHTSVMSTSRIVEMKTSRIVNNTLMPRMPLRRQCHCQQLDKFEQGHVLGLRKSGYSSDDIAQILGQNVSTVYDCWEQWSRDGIVSRPGDHVPLLKREDCCDCHTAVVHPTASAAEI